MDRTEVSSISELKSTHNTIGIVGGGKGGSEMLKLFSSIDSFRIKYVTDVNTSAPALLDASQMGIYSSIKVEKTIVECPVDFIIEATGSAEVREMIISKAPKSTEVISSRMAMILFTIFHEQRNRTASTVAGDIGRIRDEIADETKRVSELVLGINEITLGMKILSLNAAVEAARAGNHGAGFAVVAGEMKSMSDRTRALSDRIHEINKSIEAMSTRIKESLEKLS